MSQNEQALKKQGQPRRMGMGMGHGPMGGGSGEKPQNTKDSIKKLGSLLKPYRFRIILVVIFAIASTVFTVLGPKILGNATTILVEGLMAKITNTGSIDFEQIGSIIITLLGLYLLSAALAYVQGFIMTRVANDVTYNLRQRIHAKVDRLPLKYFDTTNYGEVLSHITNDVDAINNSLQQGLSQMITSVVSIVGILIMMFSINWQMSLVGILVLPVSMAVIGIIFKGSQKYFKAQLASLGIVNGQVEEMYGNHVIVKAFNGEKQAVEVFNKANDDLYDSAWKSQFFSGLMMPLMNSIGNLGYVAISIMGGYYASIGAISIGSIQSFIQYMRSFTQPIAQMASQSTALQSTLAATEKIFKLLEEEELVADSENYPSAQNIEGNVKFDHVKFGYSADKVIVKDFVADIKKGQKIAIVGPTGAGKTTMVKLLMRFYDVLEGSILVDGHDLRDFRRNDLRHVFGMVLQDTWLYNENIRENIRYGNLNASDEDVYKAAKMAQVDHFVQTLPEGYDMVLNEDSSNISQGQKQLLTIARAILADPKVLILDEATSSVDTRTEVHIQKAMDVLMEGRTSFIIAHRLSTIKNADLILVMDHGDIVEKGNHEELLEANGFYAKLYNSQFEPEEIEEQSKQLGTMKQMKKGLSM